MREVSTKLTEGETTPQSADADSCSPQTAHPLSLRDIPLTGGPLTRGAV